MPKRESLAWFLFWEGDRRQPAHHTNGSRKAACITVPHLPAHAMGTERCNYFPKITQGFSGRQFQGRACKSLAESMAVSTGAPTSHMFLDSSRAFWWPQVPSVHDNKYCHWLQGNSWPSERVTQHFLRRLYRHSSSESYCSNSQWKSHLKNRVQRRINHRPNPPLQSTSPEAAKLHS